VALLPTATNFELSIPPVGTSVDYSPSSTLWRYTPGGTNPSSYSFPGIYRSTAQPGRPAQFDFSTNGGVFPQSNAFCNFAPTRNGKYAFYFCSSFPGLEMAGFPFSIWAFSLADRQFLWPLIPLNETNWANGVKMNASHSNSPPVRNGHALAVIGRSLYVFGGRARAVTFSQTYFASPSMQLSNDMWRFDLECWPGTFQNPQVDFFDCIPCPAGSYQYAMNRNLSVCIACPFNTTGVLPGAYNENLGCNVTCPPNSYWEVKDGAGVCSTCPNGSYLVDASCQPCGANAYTTPGLNQCFQCAPGQSANSTLTGCSQCDFGHYVNASTDFKCHPCPAGFVPDQTQTACVPCEPGTSSTEGSTLCSSCLDGFVSSEATGHLCTPCELNLVAGVDHASCSSCPPGFVSQHLGITCSQCPIGAITSFPGSSCTSCPSGSQPGPEKDECDFCTGRTYSSSSTNFICVECPIGFAPTIYRNKCEPAAPTSAPAPAVVNSSTSEPVNVPTIPPISSTIAPIIQIEAPSSIPTASSSPAASASPSASLQPDSASRVDNANRAVVQDALIPIWAVVGVCMGLFAIGLILLIIILKRSAENRNF
jgi:hypothetical protein